MDSTSDSRSQISSVAHLSFTVKEQQNSTLFDTKRDGALEKQEGGAPLRCILMFSMWNDQGAVAYANGRD